jgi:hypothetical protein
MSHVTNQKNKNHSSEQQSRVGNLSVLQVERTHSVRREPVDSIEHAMDIVIGAEGEPWAEARAARQPRAA